MRREREEASRNASTSGDAVNAIYRFFEEHPGHSVKECASHLGYKIGRVYRIVKKLHHANKLAMREEIGDRFRIVACYSAVDVGAATKHEDEPPDSANGEEDKTLCGLFRYKTFDATLLESRELADPSPLWKTFWYEGEICCLFADTGAGKSILAVQIAKEIAQSRKVLYYDFEMSEKHFEMRYKDTEGALCKFTDNLIRVEIDLEEVELIDFEDRLIAGIEKDALAMGVDTIIVDNLSWLSSNMEDGDLAGKLMMKLIQMKKRHNWSILVLAHTPKRDVLKPITQNDLAGSKRVLNFLDGAFSIGLSEWGVDMRYIKQIKSRFGRIMYGADNVISAEIKKDGAFLHLVEIGTAKETEHFKKQIVTPKSKEPQSAMKARRLFATLLNGEKTLSYAELKTQSGLKHSTFVNRLNKAKEMGIISFDEDTSCYRLTSN